MGRLSRPRMPERTAVGGCWRAWSLLHGWSVRTARGPILRGPNRA